MILHGITVVIHIQGTPIVKETLRPTVFRPVCPGVRPPSWSSDQFLFSFPLKSILYISSFLITERPLLREGGFVI
jgi:hypothetical protein